MKCSRIFATGVVAVVGLAQSFTAHAQLPKPVTTFDYYDWGYPNAAKVELGKFLFFDKEISGNRNISCATCHHTMAATGDGLSLPIGEGGIGLGMTRSTEAEVIHERVPRNAPPVFNLGAREFSRMFHDGRVEPDPSQPTGFRSPAGSDLPAGLDNVLAVQAMFPVTSATEMAGQPGENPIADATDVGNLAGPGGVWELLAHRLRAIPEYVDLFQSAYSDVNQASDITFVHAANAMAAFEATAWRADNSPFDRYLRGDVNAMSPHAVQGMQLFYGKAQCASCHSGAFQTDHQFHSICMPQIGPGKGDGPDGHDDFGREQVTGNPADRFKFRTPTLRNVALTGPWGHDGAYDSLLFVTLHHFFPQLALEFYDRSQAVLPADPTLSAQDFVAHDDRVRRSAIGASSEAPRVPINLGEFMQILEFMNALTDPNSIDLRKNTPTRVPSGLPMYD